MNLDIGFLELLTNRGAHKSSFRDVLDHKEPTVQWKGEHLIAQIRI